MPIGFIAWISFFAIAIVILSATIIPYGKKSYAKETLRYFITFLASISLIIAYGRITGRPLSSIGFDISPGILPLFGAGLCLGTVLAFASFLLLWAGGSIAPRFAKLDFNLLWWLPFTAFLTLLQAGTEEFLLRTVLLQKLVESYGVNISCILWGGSFGLLHLLNKKYSFPAVLSISLAGIVLSYVFVQTGSVWASVGIHAAWNFAVAQIFESGRVVYFSPVHSFWGGQSRGIEGTPASILVLAVAAVWAGMGNILGVWVLLLSR